jgi:hypothetical protein
MHSATTQSTLTFKGRPLPTPNTTNTDTSIPTQEQLQSTFLPTQATIQHTSDNSLSASSSTLTPEFVHDEVRSLHQQQATGIPFLPISTPQNFVPIQVMPIITITPSLSLNSPPPSQLPELPPNANLLEANSTTQLRRPSRPMNNPPNALPVRKLSNPEPIKINSQPQPLINISAPFTNKHKDFVETYLKRTVQLGLLAPDTPAAILVKELPASVFNQERDSIQLISLLKPEYAKEVAYNKDVFHVTDFLASEDINQAILNTKGSAVRLSGGGEKPYTQANAQVSVLQLTTMQTNENNVSKTVQLHALFIPLPALKDTTIICKSDTSGNVDQDTVGLKSAVYPEMATYLGTSTVPPTFNKDKHQLAFDTLGEHILLAANSCNPKRIVLSDLGMGLDALAAIDNKIIFDKNNPNTGRPTYYETTAQLNAARSLASTIKKLQDQGIEVCFTDVLLNNPSQFYAQNFWDRVNIALNALKATPISPVSKTNPTLGAGWAKKTDMIIIASNHTLAGNGLLLEQPSSPNSAFGCISTANAVQTAACIQHNTKQQGTLVGSK